MSLDRCRVIAGRLATLLDNDQFNASEFDIMRARASLPEDSMWRPIEGVRLRDLGPGFPEQTPREFLSVGSYIVRRGGEVGQELVNRVRGMWDAWRNNASKDVVRLSQFLRPLVEAEHVNFVEVMQQRSLAPLANGLLEPMGSRAVAPANARVERAVAEARKYFAEINQGARARNIDNGYHEFYFPQMRETAELMNDQKRLETLEAIAWQRAVRRTGGEISQPAERVPRDRVTITEADRKFAADKYDSFAVPQLARIAPNIEELRTLDVPGFDINPLRVINRYAQAARHRFAEYDMFGARDTLHGKASGWQDLMERLYPIMSTQTDRARLLTFEQNVLGYAPSDPMLHSAAGRFLSNIQPLKLTFSVISNAQGSVNTIFRNNTMSFLKATYDLLTDREVVGGIGARDMALSMGLAVDNVIKDATLYQGGRVGEAVLKYTGFTPVEKMNRMLAGYTGAMFLRQQYDLAAKGSKSAAKRLHEYGFDLEDLRSRNGPDFDDMLIAGRRSIDETQFADTPTTKLKYFQENKLLHWLIQFRSFTLKNTDLFAREMQRRPGRAVMFGLGVMPAVGTGVEFVKDTLREDVFGSERAAYKDNMTPFQQYVQGMVAGATFGIASDLIYSIIMREHLGDLAANRLVVPPIMSTLIDAGAAAGDVYRAKFDAAGRALMRQFGPLGSAFARELLPPEE